MKIHLGASFYLPLEVVTQSLGILAKRRAGKSYTGRRFSEQFFKAGLQIVIVDPKGDWWGIRSSADGKSPGLPIVILGGEHDDVPLETNSGEVVAKLVVHERVSVLLDLAIFRKHEVATFMTAFLENLYRLKAREEYRTPMMLIIDEADAIAPQKPQKGEERMLGAAEDIVRRGGQRGIGCTLITQRSAVLNKNVLTQTQILVPMRTIAPQDLDAMKAWVDVHGTQEERKTLMESLPSLPTGTAWFWSPGWPTEEGIFKRVEVLPIETFDSGATPRPGEKRIQPKNLADVDLQALRNQMAATIERAKAEDPKELKKQIADLKRQLSTKFVPVQTKIEARVERIEVPILKNSQIKQLDVIANRFEIIGQRLISVSAVVKACIREAITAAVSIQAPKPVKTIPKTTTERSTVVERSKPDLYKKAETNGSGSLQKGERIILKAIAQYPTGSSDAQIAVLTGYKATSRREYLKALRSKGYVTSLGDHHYSTDEGIVALGPDFEPLPTGQDLQDYWMNRLTGGEKLIFETIISNNPNRLSNDEIQQATGYKATSVREYLKKLKARKLLDSNKDGSKASEDLFN